ncbi:hypothetical protein L1987_71895 [Smallanthus sonchifolius]|uniref:Uncharacterized protein n=1 Tax=Smallanthus sonchifolius TaxID=185202 RepID=A0ACB9AY24_9ASTR|nr:hypothetical protein L1987_71895 [Smallanthus sonchifolius]
MASGHLHVNVYLWWTLMCTSYCQQICTKTQALNFTYINPSNLSLHSQIILNYIHNHKRLIVAHHLEMASKGNASLVLFLVLNLLFFAMVSGCGTCGSPTPKPKPKPKTPKATCPKDTLKLAVCADLLGLVNVVVGSPPTKPCCSLIEGLADLEAAVCLCTAIKANVLGNNLNVPVSLSLLLNVCGKKVPSGFKCA